MEKKSQVSLFKIPAASETIKTEVVCPNDTNPMGMLQGGRLVEWMDIAAAVAAQTHSGKICVTASIDHVDFNKSAGIGDIITIKAALTRVFSSSMEVFVRANARKVTAGSIYLISEAYFTFVALDETGNPAPVIQLQPVSSDEVNQFNNALSRKEYKKGRKIKISNS